MLFNSFDFGLFLIVVFVLYWAIGSKRIQHQNILLLIASYFFYGFWDWRFLLLLISSSLVDYFAGIYLSKTPHKTKRKFILFSSLLWNLGVLFTFKYFNFFIDSFETVLGLDNRTSYSFWNTAIPVGLSFYTFQTMSYTIDVYRRDIKPTEALVPFLCYVCFFPQLVAGPIERAKNMIPQFLHQRVFKLQDAKEGLRQILWGLFKKIIVAEKIGLAVDALYAAPEEYHFLTILYGGVLFMMQLYCDFSGYTDIALGSAKLFGFKLSKNFNLPYLATSISDFWQRWHITLTQWFTKYVYIPFVANFKYTSIAPLLGAIITMTLVGFWHGASWNFLLFGFLNGLIVIVERIPLVRGRNIKSIFEHKYRLISLVYTYAIYAICCLIFRAEDLDQITILLQRVFTFETSGFFNSLIGWKVGYLLVMLFVEIWFRKKEYPLQALERWLPKPLRWTVYYTLIFIIINYAEPKEAFIYFQF